MTILEPRADYDSAIIGITENADSEDVLVYKYELLIEVCVGMGMSWEEAVEYTDYNTIRAIPYMGKTKPVVVRDYDDGYYEELCLQDELRLRDDG